MRGAGFPGSKANFTGMLQDGLEDRKRKKFSAVRHVVSLICNRVKVNALVQCNLMQQHLMIAILTRTLVLSHPKDHMQVFSLTVV